MSLLSASARRHGQAGGVAAAADGQSRREPILMTIDVLDRPPGRTRRLPRLSGGASLGHAQAEVLSAASAAL